jgi:hypothetical protein
MVVMHMRDTAAAAALARGRATLAVEVRAVVVDSDRAARSERAAEVAVAVLVTVRRVSRAALRMIDDEENMGMMTGVIIIFLEMLLERVMNDDDDSVDGRSRCSGIE